MTCANRTTQKLVKALNGERLWDRHLALARIGATAGGGVRRLALGELDHQARRHMAAWAGERGYAVSLDPIGNLFIRREGALRGAAPVLTGSHLDTQPSGGRFDGAFGVLAGCEVLQALDDAGVHTRRPIEVVSWANEEGCRFPPGGMGSACFAQPELLAQWLACTDTAGLSVAEELRRLPELPRRPLGADVHAYVEAHIEQGPLLEREQASIGIVSGIQGCRDFSLAVRGAEGHAGTTPLAGRRDALRCAVGLLDALYRLAEASDEATRLTVGELQVLPNSSSVIPGEVRLAIDFRHPSNEALREIGDRVLALCRAHAGVCEVDVRETRWREPIAFPSALQALVQAAADRQGLRSLVLPSGANHDAGYLHRVCPAGMLFVPCAGGLSHNERESAEPQDLHRGTQVLAEVLLALAE